MVVKEPLIVVVVVDLVLVGVLEKLEARWVH